MADMFAIEFYQKVLYIRLEMNLKQYCQGKFQTLKVRNTLCPTM